MDFSNKPMDDLLQATCDAARQGGKVLMQYYAKAVPREKSPKDLVTEGKRIVVIGSGATAATVIPNLK